MMLRLYAFLLVFIVLAGQAFALEEKEQLIIRKIPLQHCMKGPSMCEKCRAMSARKYCLLNISPKGVMARPVIEVEIKGKKEWREYEIVKIFEDRDEADRYAKGNGITDVKWEND